MNRIRFDDVVHAIEISMLFDLHLLQFDLVDDTNLMLVVLVHQMFQLLTQLFDNIVEVKAEKHELSDQQYASIVLQNATPFHFQ